ncbi:Universal stress protein [Natrarchaeobaculum sulfurireducens]|uniref:Nucleotide-binding protein, UspA family n=1 Tax=Natrarchaeobaculum sulfurireducens TaxID=2044521 RepID=A0A346PM46_9EURY|nr:Nucleotide-binding protein, UspA family [Natrarchaeobaculum sulfurireducens]AXR80591.1 Universal stress protein [Natrarchaeobaculum sulfurireducens]
MLIPIEVLEGEGIPESIASAFESIPVVLLGYHELPDQTPPEQARTQFEERATAKLDELAAAFEDAGGTWTTRLVFTRDALQTFERIAVELECDGVVLLNPIRAIDRVLVPLRSGVNVSNIAELVSRAFGDGDAEVTLLHVTSEESDADAGRELLEEAAETLVENGVDPERLLESVVVDDAPLETIVEVADDHDFVVVGESKPSIQDRIFGDPSERIATRTVSPVLIVRQRFLEMDDDDREDRVETLEETADEFSGDSSS